MIENLRNRNCFPQNSKPNRNPNPQGFAFYCVFGKYAKLFEDWWVVGTLCTILAD